VNCREQARAGFVKERLGYHSGIAASHEPVTTLRGASVEVDSRRVVAALGYASVVALAAVVVTLFAVGAHANAQIGALRLHGVRVEVKVSKCVGLLGGSGSNGAGYSCSGTFALDGRSYGVRIPGNILRPPGSTVNLVAAEDDPGLVATVQQLKTEHASWKEFVLPSALLAVLGALVTVLAVRRRKIRGSSGQLALRLGRDFAADSPF